jgi:heme oxygenase (biliverdin-IX-beta and delta-forming)
MSEPESPHCTTPQRDPQGLALRLRRETAEAHEAIERLPLMRRLTSPEVTLDDYRRYLRTMAEIYSPLETALYAGLGDALRERLGVAPKQSALLGDLAELEDSPVPDSSAPGSGDGLPELLSELHPSALVGGLYVLEGATLGGRTIARHLRAVLGDSFGGGHFLDFHGRAITTAWPRFSAALVDLARDGTLDADETVAGALATFALIHRRLSVLD